MRVVNSIPSMVEYTLNLIEPADDDSTCNAVFLSQCVCVVIIIICLLLLLLLLF